MLPYRTWLICWCAWLFLSGLARGDGVILDGLSGRSIGRGGTNIAHCDNGTILHDNPAGAVNIFGEHLFEIGGTLLTTDFRYSDPENPAASDSRLSPLPQAAYIRRSEDGLWAYGLGVFSPAGFSAVYDLQTQVPLWGQRRYKSFGSLIKVLPTAACRLTERLSLGASVGIGITHNEIEGPYFLQGPSPLRGLPTVLDLQATGVAPCWSLGLQYDLSEATRLGVTYQSQTRFDLSGRARVEVPLMGESAYSADFDMRWPESLGIGMRHELSPCQTFSTDVIWYGWSRAFDNLGINFHTPSNGIFPELYDEFPLNWRDTVSVRLGYEQDLGCYRTFRLGYVYHRSPVPDGTITPYIQAILEHAVSVGYGFVWNCWNVDLAYMFSFGPSHSVGISDIVGGDFDYSRNRAQTHAVGIGLMRQW